MFHFSTPIVLGLISGITIFLGLPVALIPGVSEKLRGFLNAVSTGILVFLMVEILGQTLEWIEDLFQSASGGFHTSGDALKFSFLLLAGLSIGLLGMVYFEKSFIRGGKDELPEEGKARKLSLMISFGIGIHNLTEGLAIAQAYSWENSHLALSLAAGFALHNATEGFGIAAPLSGRKQSLKFLALTGLIAGGPTVLGAVVGSWWQSDVLRVLSFGLAAGAILYIVGELLHIGRRLRNEGIVEIGLLVGFAVAFTTEMFIVMAGGAG